MDTRTLLRVGGVGTVVAALCCATPILVILLGLVFMGFIPLFQREFRIHRVPAVGLAVAPLLGALFGVGWLPCIGPTLGTVLTLANTRTGRAPV